MSAYRGFFYFFMISLLFYSLLSSKILYLPESQDRTSIIDKLLKLDDKSQRPDIMIVETFVEMEKPKKAENISNYDNLKQGRITKEKGYSYFSNTRYLVESPESQQFQNIEKDSIGALLEEKAIQKIKEKKDSKLKKIDLLPNLYKRQQFVINMDSDGFIGVSAQNREYAQYLMEVGKKVFYNWFDFLPAYQLKMNIVKTGKDGLIQGTIGLYYDSKTQKYSMVLLTPFVSEYMNELTIRSFSYLKIPVAPKSIEMNFILARFIVYPSLKVEAEFKFDYLDKSEAEKKSEKK